MNKDNQIAELALESLKKNAGITGTWKPVRGITERLDGKLELKLNSKIVKLNAEVKSELKGHDLQKILAMAAEFNPLIVIAQYIYPRIKEELREKGIAYLETNGNIFLKQQGNLIWLELQKGTPPKIEKINRAFSKTGLKVLFYFLLKEDLVNLPYREISTLTDVALGNITYVITGLKEQNFLLKLGQHQYKIQNKKELFENWITAYERRLKPDLEIGTFRFARREDFSKWQNLPLDPEKILWGGEPAGDLITNYLKPAELTLYTTQGKNELIKRYRIVPDPHGNIKVYKKFWQNIDTGHLQGSNKVVPPILIYADLMNTGDRRCIETAGKVYEQYLQDKF